MQLLMIVRMQDPDALIPYTVLLRYTLSALGPPQISSGEDRQAKVHLVDTMLDEFIVFPQ